MLRWYTGNGNSVPPRSTLARSDPLPPLSEPATGAGDFDFAASGVTVASLGSVFGLTLDVCGAGSVGSSGRSAARGAGASGVGAGAVVTTPMDVGPACAATI